MAAALSQIGSVTVMIAVILWLLLSRNGSESELAHSFRRAAYGGPDRRDRLVGPFPGARPQGGHRADRVRDRVGSLLIVDAPADELRPRLLGRALDREIYLFHPGDGVEEFLVGQGDALVRVRCLGNLQAHRPGDLGEADEPAPQAEPGRHLWSNLRRKREEQGRPTQDAA